MSQADWGAAIAAALGAIIWIITAEVRLRNVQAELILSKQKNADNETVNAVHSLSDNELDAELRIQLAPGPAKNPS
jgi:hypothetical protein